MISYAVESDRIVLTATGFVSEEEAIDVFDAIRRDPNVPPGLPWLMDLRQYDHTSMNPTEIQPRVLRMLGIVGPKVGKYWAMVVDSQAAHILKARFVQHLVQDNAATVMLFTDMREAEEWLAAMSQRGKEVSGD